MGAPAALRSRPFQLYVLGQLPSVTCSWAQVVAISWLVVDRAPWALGWVVALQFLPSLLLGPYFGVLADRHDRRRLLMWAEGALGLVALAYAALAATDRLTVAHILLLSAAWGVVNALDTPARRAMVPMLVPPEHAAGAAALTGTVLLLGMTAGSALGGALVAAFGVTVAFAVNAASFAADIAVLHAIRIGPSPRVARAPRQLRDGLRHAWHTPTLRSPLLALAIIATLAFPGQVSVPILLRSSFDGGASDVGAALTALTAGSLAGTLAAATRNRLDQRGARTATAVLAATLAATAAAPTLPAVLTGLAGVGLAWSYLLSSVFAALQTAEPAMMGRVMSLLAVVLLGGMAAGAPIAGSVAAATGPRAPFVLGAVACAAALGVLRTQPARLGPHRARPAGDWSTSHE